MGDNKEMAEEIGMTRMYEHQKEGNKSIAGQEVLGVYPLLSASSR